MTTWAGERCGDGEGRAAKFGKRQPPLAARPETGDLRREMQTISDSRKLSEISQLGRRETVGFRALPPERKRLVLDRLGEITAKTIKAAVADVNGKWKVENGK